MNPTYDRMMQRVTPLIARLCHTPNLTTTKAVAIIDQHLTPAMKDQLLAHCLIEEWIASMPRGAAENVAAPGPGQHWTIYWEQVANYRPDPMGVC